MKKTTALFRLLVTFDSKAPLFKDRLKYSQNSKMQATRQHKTHHQIFCKPTQVPSDITLF